MNDVPIQRLLKEHEQIRAACDAMWELVESAQPVDSDTLQKARWALARAILQHLPLDERMVMGPLELHPDATVRATAERFRRGAQMLSEASLDHTAKWPESTALRDWAAYGRAVRTLIERVRDRLQEEERELYPLAMNLTQPAAQPLKHNWASKAWSFRANIHRPS